MNQEFLFGETICLGAKWVSRKGKIKRIARKDRDSRNEAEKPFERKFTGTRRTERTAGLCFRRENELMCRETTPEKENITYITHTFVAFVEG